MILENRGVQNRRTPFDGDPQNRRTPLNVHVQNRRTPPFTLSYTMYKQYQMYYTCTIKLALNTHFHSIFASSIGKRKKKQEKATVAKKAKPRDTLHYSQHGCISSTLTPLILNPALANTKPTYAATHKRCAYDCKTCVAHATQKR